MIPIWHKSMFFFPYGLNHNLFFPTIQISGSIIFDAQGGSSGRMSRKSTPNCQRTDLQVHSSKAWWRRSKRFQKWFWNDHKPRFKRHGQAFQV